MKQPEPSPSAKPVDPLTPTLNAASAEHDISAPSSASPDEYVLLIRSTKGTLHLACDPRKGPGAALVFSDASQAKVAIASDPLASVRKCYIIKVE